MSESQIGRNAVASDGFIRTGNDVLQKNSGIICRCTLIYCRRTVKYEKIIIVINDLKIKFFKGKNIKQSNLAVEFSTLDICRQTIQAMTILR